MGKGKLPLGQLPAPGHPHHHPSVPPGASLPSRSQQAHTLAPIASQRVLVTAPALQQDWSPGSSLCSPRARGHPGRRLLEVLRVWSRAAIPLCSACLNASGNRLVS